MERSLSINLRERQAIRLGLLHFGQSLQGKAVGVFIDNTTALSYVRRQWGGTFSMALNQEAQLLLRWAGVHGPASGSPVYRGGPECSAAFLQNWSVFKVLEAATWRSNPVFASFYFRDISFSLDSSHSLGPFVTGGKFGFTVRALSFHFFLCFYLLYLLVIFVARVLLFTIWCVCLLPGFGLLLGLTYD